MVLKESVEEMFPQWPGEDDDQQLDNLIRDLHSGRFVTGDYWDVQRKEKKKNKKTKLAIVPCDSEPEPPKKKQKKDEKHEGEGADIEQKEDGKGGSEDAADMKMIVATMDKISTRLLDHDSMCGTIFETFRSKFEDIDSNFGELTRKVVDMEKKIGDYVKVAVDERLKVLGFSETAQNSGPSPKSQPRPKSVHSRTVSLTHDNVVGAKNPSVEDLAKAEESRTQQHKSVNSPPDPNTPEEKTLADELGKAKEKGLGAKLKAKEQIPKGTEAKKNLFGNDVDFVSVSPPKPQPQEVRRNTRRRKGNENEDDLKKKADAPAKKRSDAAVKGAATRKENNRKKKEAAELKKKEDEEAAELKKKEDEEAAELKKVEVKKEVQIKQLRSGVIRIHVPDGNKKGKTEGQSDVLDVTEEVLAKENELLPESDEDDDERLRLARIKEYRASVVQLDTTGLAVKGSSVPSAVFPYAGDNGTTCMRKGFEPSSAIYDPLAPVDRAKLDKLMQHLKPFEAIPLTDDSNEEVYFYRILMAERKDWPSRDYGWLFDNHVGQFVKVLIKRSMQDPSPFWSKRIAFLDQWFLSAVIQDYNQFKICPKKFNFTEGYQGIMKGQIPTDLQTNKKWFEDVDHLYGVLQTGGDHWVAFHVDLLKEQIDVYDSIIGHVTPESQAKMVAAFRPLLQMIPAMINRLIPGRKTVCQNQFAFRWKSVKNIPQNTQVGDCGVYALKFIECLALGVTFDGISDANIQGLRVKMAAEIHDEAGFNMLAQFD